MKKRLFFAFLFSILFCAIIWGCQEDKPILTDGNMSFHIVVLDTTGIFNPADSTRRTPIPNAKITVETAEYQKKYIYYTDSTGRADITGLLASQYEISAEFPFSVSTVLLGAISRDIFCSSSNIDTIKTYKVNVSPIVINEAYTCGPVNNTHFFFDQFVELYNTTDEVQYLDGLIITRCVTNPDNDPFIDIWDYVMNVYAFQFPGTPGGTEYPIEPDSFVVIAADAYNHGLSVPGAVNLENADWECYNQLGSDWDNPDVPNLLNINPEKPKEFMVSLTYDAIILAEGTNFWQDGKYIDIHISTILDGVEYKSSASTPKHLTRRLDSGCIYGVTSYSGKSRERTPPGKDTNNSGLDFMVIDHPTPGYHWND